MAKDISEDAMDLHNEMVFHLSEAITLKQLYKLKYLLFGNTLSANEKEQIETIQELFNHLHIKEFIFIGDYTKIVKKLKLINPQLCSIVDNCTKEIEKLRREEDIDENMPAQPKPSGRDVRDSTDGMVIQMDKSKYHANERSTAFVTCTVDPEPNSITWKMGHEVPPSKRIKIDNRKFFSGCPKAPTLVINGATKEMDEGHYQCSAEANLTAKEGKIVHLEVYPDDDYGRQSSSQSSSSPRESSPYFKKMSISSTRRKRYGSDPTAEMHSQYIGTQDFGINDDQGTQASVVIKNEIDPKRPESVIDISKGFAEATNENGRVKCITLKTHCILLCIDITPARSLVEPSSVHLAEQFRHYLLDGGRIQLSDESRTILDIDEATFKITPQNACQDGRPYVNISHGMFTVPVGGSVILQTYLVAPKEATSIRWFKIKRNQQMAIEIDNEKYFGGSDFSPTLIVRSAKIDDQGRYLCWATNKFGTGSSNTSCISIQSVVTQVKQKIICLESKTGVKPRSKDFIFKSLPKQNFDPKTLVKKARIMSEGSSSDKTDMVHTDHAAETATRSPSKIEKNLPAICGEETASKSLGDATDENMPVQPKPSGRDILDSTENLPAICGDNTASKSLGDATDENMPVQPKPSGGDILDSTGENMPVQQKPSGEDIGDSTDSNHNRKHMIDVHPKFANMIESTKLMLKDQENKKHWVDTKGYVEAKKTLLKNELHVVIIKGNSGDGKTSIACQLLRELCTTEEDGQQRRGRQPLELNYIKDLDKLANKSGLAIFLDDLFGKNDVNKEDLKELKKLERHLLAKLRGDENSEVNFLIITIQSLIFNSVQKHLTGKLFSESCIIDLTSSKYFGFDDKRKLLRMYVPEDKEFEPWKDDEVDKIVELAPDIGFPQCCRLFRDSDILQKRRVAFFETPFYFLKSLMVQLTGGQVYGLVYLFFKGGEVTITDLDPENKNCDQRFLNAAFAVDVIDVDPTAEVLYKQGTKEYVQKSLELLAGSLVKNVEVEIRKQHCQEFTKVRAFRFSHDSIEQTVAILYGEKTHVGFIENCPRKFLSYIHLATNRHSEHSIVLTEGEHTALCSRLLTEFKDIQLEHQEHPHSDIGYLYHCITLMDVWADIDFLKGFLCWLDDEKCDENLSKRIKLTLLNASCSYGSNERALHLLQQGATFDESTLSCVIEGDCVDVLKEIDRDLSNDTKTDLMNKACSMGKEECALHLLSGNKINDDTPFCVVEGGSSRILDQMLPYIKEETRAETTRAPNRVVYKINVLHEACLFQREEMVEMLCDNIPNMIIGETKWYESVFHLVSKTGNCSMFHYLERKMYLRSKGEDQVCDSLGSDAIHKNCPHEQYMCKLKDDDGLTVLHQSCISGVRDLAMYLCKCYPALTHVLSNDECHCLHYVAEYTQDVALFKECEICVKQNMESMGQTYDITEIKDNKGLTIFDKTISNAKKMKSLGLQTNPLTDYISQTWPSAATSDDK